MHGKGASLEQIYKWAEEKFGSVGCKLRVPWLRPKPERGTRRAGSVVASKDLSFLNGHRNPQRGFRGQREVRKLRVPQEGDLQRRRVDGVRGRSSDNNRGRAVNCDAGPRFFTYDEHGEVFCTSCGEVQPIRVEELNAYQQSGKTSSEDRARSIRSLRARPWMPSAASRLWKKKEVVFTAVQGSYAAPSRAQHREDLQGCCV